MNGIGHRKEGDASYSDLTDCESGSILALSTATNAGFLVTTRAA
jgi:hypothetical protein